MNDLRKAAEQALEALESIKAWYKWKGGPFENVMEALRQALATQVTTQDITQVTMQVTTQMAKRKTLVELLDSTPDDAINMSEERVHKTDKREQEPVCFLTETAWSYEIANWGDPNGFPVYTVPPQKEWVGLTDKEKNELVDAFYGTDIQRLEAIEAKLKEKNCA